MKKIYSFLALLFLIGNSLNSQIESEVTGVWQWKKDGVLMKSADLGLENVNDNEVFTVLSKDNSMYLVFAKSVDEIDESKLSSLLSNQLAEKGSYKLDGYQIDGDIEGSPFLFTYSDDTKKLKKLDETENIELTKVKNFNKITNLPNLPNTNSVVYPTGGSYYNNSHQFYGEEYYGGIKRRIMIAPDGSKYYLGPTGRKVYIEKNGVVKIKSDIQKNQSLSTKSSNSIDSHFGNENYAGQNRKIMITSDGSKYYLGPSGKKVYVEKNGVKTMKTDDEKKANKQKLANQKAIQSQNRTKTKGSGKTGSYGNSSSSKKSGG